MKPEPVASVAVVIATPEPVKPKLIDDMPVGRYRQAETRRRQGTQAELRLFGLAKANECNTFEMFEFKSGHKSVEHVPVRDDIRLRKDRRRCFPCSDRTGVSSCPCGACGRDVKKVTFYGIKIN